jgi:hypothetical protein
METVAWVGIAKEHDKPVTLSLRLKVVNLRITEAESIVIRDVNEKSLANLKTPSPASSEALAPSERVSRQELIRISSLYFDGIENFDGRIVPFDKECYRLERGRGASYSGDSLVIVGFGADRRLRKACTVWAS